MKLESSFSKLLPHFIANGVASFVTFLSLLSAKV